MNKNIIIHHMTCIYVLIAEQPKSNSEMMKNYTVFIKLNTPIL